MTITKFFFAAASLLTLAGIPLNAQEEADAYFLPEPDTFHPLRFGPVKVKVGQETRTRSQISSAFFKFRGDPFEGWTLASIGQNTLGFKSIFHANALVKFRLIDIDLFMPELSEENLDRYVEGLSIEFDSAERLQTGEAFGEMPNAIQSPMGIDYFFVVDYRLEKFGDNVVLCRDLLFDLPEYESGLVLIVTLERPASVPPAVFDPILKKLYTYEMLGAK